MTNDIFLDEIKSYIGIEYNDFVKYQNIVLDILDEFDRICKMNSICYSLAYGTLLGAIRDQHQIPWDYDIDLFVPNYEKDKLLNALKNDLSPLFYYCFWDNMIDYPTTCLRVCKKGYTYMALHVDVFFLIGCPNNEKRRLLFVRRVNRISNIRQNRFISKHINYKYDSLLLSLSHKLKQSCSCIIPLRLLQKWESALFSKIKLGDSLYCMPYGVYNHVFMSEWFSDYKHHAFGKIDTFVPSGYEHFLKYRYGNYKEYVGISERFEEFHRIKNIVDTRQKDYLEKINVHDNCM